MNSVRFNNMSRDNMSFTGQPSSSLSHRHHNFHFSLHFISLGRAIKLSITPPPASYSDPSAATSHADPFNRQAPLQTGDTNFIPS